MKLFRDYEHADMGMVHDPLLKTALAELAANIPVETVIETGTHLGLGSTTLLAQAFERKGTRIHTIEANYESYHQARKNLKKYPSVRCHYGCSTRLDQARDFIKRDPAILNHELFPGIFIDNTEDPVAFYSREVEGLLSATSAARSWWANVTRPTFEDDLLTKLVSTQKEDNLLIVLDSAGGVGKLEFELVKQLLPESDYCLLLDDTHHLKHFRSVEEICSDHRQWQVLSKNDVHGWMLARHRASVSAPTAETDQYAR